MVHRSKVGFKRKKPSIIPYESLAAFMPVTWYTTEDDENTEKK